MRPIFPPRQMPQFPTLIRKPPPETRAQLVYNNPSPKMPLHLSDSVIVQSGSSGTVNPAALKNPMGQDMELLEIKFELQSAFVGGSASALGGTISAELTMGGLKLTNEAIPVWGFGRAENLSAETQSGRTPDGASVGFIYYSWRLPRPLYIPAGDTVIPTFTHSGNIATPIGVRVGYSCRTTTRPRIAYVPWVTKYISRSFNPLEDAGVDASGPLNLVNPHDQVVYIQRFTGRTLAKVVVSASSQPTVEADPISFGAKYLQMRMTDSYGRPIVRTFTPFRSVFSAGSRSWECDNGTILDPKSFYIVNLKKDAMVLAATNEGSFGQAQITMVGWREIPV